MRKLAHILVSKILIGLFYWDCDGKDDNSSILTSTDSLWLRFAIAMEQEDIEFLVSNSMDSIHCVDCNHPIGDWGDEIFESEYLFRNHLKELMHLENLKTGFSTYQDSLMIRVIYAIETSQSEEGAYGLVFTLEKKNGEYQLSDRFFIP